jgi:hypothetical protein
MGQKHALQVYVGRIPLAVDFKRLRKQKRALACVLGTRALSALDAEFEGLLSFLDAFQDAAAKIHGDKVVFGKDA